MSELDQILRQLAEGNLDPEQAADQIQRLSVVGTSFEATDGPDSQPQRAMPDEASAPDESQPRRPAHGDQSDDQIIDAEVVSESEADPAQTDVANGRPQFTTHGREDFSPRAQPSAPSTAAPSAAAPSAAKPTNDEQQATEQDEEPTTEQPAVDDQTSPAANRSARRTRPTTINGINRVQVLGRGRRVRIIGDPQVATTEVVGKHTVRRNGRTLEIEAEANGGPSLRKTFSFRLPRTGDDLRDLALGKALVVRVNPALLVDAEVTGSGLTIESVPVLGRIRVTAGRITVTGVVELQDVLLQATAGTISGDIGRGRSRVQVESGTVEITLGPEANLTVRADARMGMIRWPGDYEGRIDEYSIGNGAARMDVSVTGGVVTLRHDENADDDDDLDQDDPQD